MVLAIISFALEFIFIAAGPVMMSNMSQGFAIFVVVMFCLCTFTSIGCIPYNVKKMRNSYSKAPSIVGLVFSIIGANMGLVVFFITFLAILVSL